MSVVKTFFKLLRITDKEKQKYHSIFIENGFDNIRFITDMNDMDLKVLNIKKESDRVKILHQIDLLKKDEVYVFLFLICGFNLQSGNDYYTIFKDNGVQCMNDICKLNQKKLMKWNIMKLGHLKMILSMIKKISK